MKYLVGPILIININLKMTEVKILADSLNQWGDRLTTFKIKFPRIIEAEILRHRVFSYSSASSRAVGLEKHIQKVAAEPFIPKEFTEDCKGMSAKKSLDEENNLIAQSLWKEAWNVSLSICEDLKDIKTHKQHASRLLQPFEYQEMLVTGTQWLNFFNLRCPQYSYKGQTFLSKVDLLAFWPELKDTDVEELNVSQAQPEIQELAEMMWNAYNEGSPKELKEGEWHLPFGDFEEYSIEQNVARCARISYLMDSKDVSGDVDLYHKLQLHKHGSAFEHVCRPMTQTEFKNLTRSFYEGEKFFNQEGWCANIRGFLSQRTILGL